MKYCPKCAEIKNYSEFHKSSRTKDGHKCYCKICSSKSRKIDKMKKNLKKWEDNRVIDLDGEIWRDIIGYEGYYQVSNLGRVKNISQVRRVSSIMKPCSKNGYFSITLAGYGIKPNKMFYVHRLVAINFLSNGDNLPQVHHIDHNRTNNTLENLRWVTQDNNSKFASEAGRFIRKDLKNKERKVAKLETVPGYYTDKSFNRGDEVWEDVLGFCGLYKISNYGRLLSYNKNKSGRLMKPGLLLCRKANKPLLHKMSLDSIDKPKTVHRLVAAHFIPNPLNLAEVNHKDGNKHNNHISNLEWVTHKENIQHAVDNGLTNKGENSFLSKLTEQQVLEIRKLKENSDISLIKLAKLYKVTPNTIKCIITRKTWTHI